MLVKVIGEYNSKFPSDWIEKLQWDDDSVAQSSYVQGKNEIDRFIKLCFNSLSISILSGEYIKTNLIPILDNFNSLLLKDYPPYSYDDHALKRGLYEVYSDLDSDLQLLIRHYEALSFFVTNRNTSARNPLFTVFSTKCTECNNPLLNNIIQYVFELCKIDYILSHDENTIQDLILFKENVNKLLEKSDDDIKDIYSILLDQCLLLTKKSIRFRKSTEYSLEFQFISLNHKDINIELFKRFDGSFDFLYDNAKDDSSEWQKKCVESNASFSEMIKLMSYYKKNKGTNTQIKNLLSYFDEKYKTYDAICAFDKYAVNTVKNYMYNSSFSELLKTKLSIEKLKEKLNEIASIQKQTHIYNFHPYYKIVRFLIDSTNRDLLYNEEEKKIDEQISILDNAFETLSDNFEWCKRRQFYPFQLPYDECLEHIDTVDFALFIPSTFAKPINYIELKETIIEYKNEIYSLKNERKLYKERQQIEVLKEEISKSKKSYVELLALFTAIITFLFSTINIFTDNTNPLGFNDKIENTAILGILLLLFSSAVHIVMMPEKDRFWTWKNIMSIIFLLFCLVYIAIMFKGTYFLL